MPNSIAISRRIATSQSAGGSSRRDSPTIVTAARARSRRAFRSSIAGMVRETVHVRSGLPATQASSASRSRVFTTFAGLDPGPPRLADAPAHVVELVGPVRVRVDRQQAAVGDGPPGALDREVEPVRRAVHLERGPGPRGLGVDLVPVEVEVVARADHPAGRVGDDVDVRAADGVERPLGQLGPRLAPGDVERRDDQVEAREQVVLEVELAVGPDLQLAAVQQPEAAGRGLGRCACPAASSAANRALSAAMISRCSATRSGVEPAGDGQRLGVVGQDLVGVAAAAGGLGHDLDRVRPVGPVRVAVQVAAEVRLR